MIDGNDIERLCMPIWFNDEKVKLLIDGYVRNAQEILLKVNVNIPAPIYSIISEYCEEDEESYDPYYSKNVNVEFEIKELLRWDVMEGKPILIFVNKQDLSGALSVDEVEKRLELKQLLSDRKWHIQSCCATEGNGLYEGWNWICDNRNWKVSK